MRMLIYCKMVWTFSIELESVCVLPQLQLLRQTSVPTVLDSYYLLTLGSYRFFYILNWIYRGAKEGYWEPVAFIFGVIQTLLYVDFAWVYYSRQRVKLRGGGVVDSDDLSKSFLVRRFLGGNRRSEDNNEDITAEDEALAGQENGMIRPNAQRGGSDWGARGISVSADSTLDHHHHQHDIDASEIADPAAFEDESDDDNDQTTTEPPAKQSPTSGKATTTDAADDTATAWADMRPRREDNGRD
jgi:ER lumen protein retaining receptor